MSADASELIEGDEEKKRRSRSRRQFWLGWWPWKFILVATLVALVAVVVAYQQRSQQLHWFVQQPPLLPGHPSKSCGCQGLDEFQGAVEDCCCDYATVDALNQEFLHDILTKIVKTPFFRYFKVRLWCDCPFWPEDGLCQLRDCSVCECPENEFPASFKGFGSDHLTCQEGKPQGIVDRTLDAQAFQGWTETDNPWTHDDETQNGDITYVNLLLNPEKFTGYTGVSAHKIWEAIYMQNCFKGGFLTFPHKYQDVVQITSCQVVAEGERDTCAERRVFYRLISGLHTSISTHIAGDYLLDEATTKWGKSYVMMHERVLMHPERVQNLYFTFLFVLRALTKAGAYLSQAEYSTGNDAEDQETHELVRRLVNCQQLRTACPIPFDEAQMWRGTDGAELKQQLQIHFRNISALMDCVGCEKCRLWGKLQILGLATALKILFSVEDSPAHTLDLQRNEVIALVNLLSRLSESLELVHEVANDIKTSNKLLGRVSSGGLGLPNESKSRWFLREADESVKSLQSLFEGM